MRSSVFFPGRKPRWSSLLLSHTRDQFLHNAQGRSGARSAQLSDMNMFLGSSPDQGHGLVSGGNRPKLLQGHGLMALSGSTAQDPTHHDLRWLRQLLTSVCSSLLSSPQFHLSSLCTYPSASLSLSCLHHLLDHQGPWVCGVISGVLCPT